MSSTAAQEDEGKVELGLLNGLVLDDFYGFVFPKNPLIQKRPRDLISKPLMLQQNLVGTSRLELLTPTMSRWCSNQLSYAPVVERDDSRTVPNDKPFFQNLI